MQDYFATTEDPERGWALAALTGELSFAEAKPSQVRDLAVSRVDPELFGWSLDFVGDLAETVALIWPEQNPHPNPPPLAGEGAVSALAIAEPPRLKDDVADSTVDPLPRKRGRVGVGVDGEQVPTLTEIVSTLSTASRASVGAHLAPWLDGLDATGRWA